MRIALFLLLACGLLAGAAAPFAPGDFAYGLAALALLLGISGLALLQAAVFGPMRALSRDLRALGKDSALPRGNEYGAMQTIADLMSEHSAGLRHELVTARRAVDEAAQDIEEWRDKYLIAVSGRQLARENLEAISQKARNLSTELAQQFRNLARGAGVVSPGVEERRFQAREDEARTTRASEHSACIGVIMRNMSEAVAPLPQKAEGHAASGREEDIRSTAERSSQFLENFNAGLVLISDRMAQLEQIVDDLDSDLCRADAGAPTSQDKLAHWSDSLAIGVTAIDEQHKLLVSYINELHRAVQQGREETVALDILDALVSYAASHFSTEEVFFTHSAYPDTERHIAIHEQFKAHVAQFRSEVEAGSATVGMDVLEFLKNWLIEHIQGTDHKIGPYVRKALEEQS